MFHVVPYGEKTRSSWGGRGRHANRVRRGFLGGPSRRGRTLWRRRAPAPGDPADARASCCTVPLAAENLRWGPPLRSLRPWRTTLLPVDGPRCLFEGRT